MSQHKETSEILEDFISSVDNTTALDTINRTAYNGDEIGDLMPGSTRGRTQNIIAQDSNTPMNLGGATLQENTTALTPRSSQHPGYTKDPFTGYSKHKRQAPEKPHAPILSSPNKQPGSYQMKDSTDGRVDQNHIIYEVQGSNNSINVITEANNNEVEIREIQRLVTKVMPGQLGPHNGHLVSAITAKVQHILIEDKKISKKELFDSLVDLVTTTVNAERTTITSENHVRLNDVPRKLDSQQETLETLVKSISQISKKLNVAEGITLDKATIMNILLQLPIDGSKHLRPGNVDVMWKAGLVTAERIKLILDIEKGVGRLELVRSLLKEAENIRMKEIARGSKDSN